MERCPACLNSCIPAWRRMFSQKRRFRCLRCSTWLRFSKLRVARDQSAWPSRHPYLWSVLLGLTGPALLTGVICLAAILGCHLSLSQLGAAFWPLLGVALLASLRSEWRQKMRAALVVAPYQDASPARDGQRDLRASMRTSDGRKSYLLLLAFSVTFGTGTVAVPVLLKKLGVHLPAVCPVDGADGSPSP